MSETTTAAEREFVSAEQFGEFVKGVNDRFDAVNRRVDDLKAEMNHRFDAMNHRFDDLRSMLIFMYTPVVVAILAAVVKMFFFS